MRKILISLLVVCLVLLTLSTAGIFNSKAENSNIKETNTIVQDEPGTRCTRLRYKDVKKNIKARASRCMRSEPHDKEFLRNAAPRIALQPSSMKVVLACPDGTVSSTCGADMGVMLSATGTDTDGDTLLYTYSATGGRLAGDGAKARWDLSGVSSGEYTASVEVDDGCGCIAFTSTSVTVAECDSCKQ